MRGTEEAFEHRIGLSKIHKPVDIRSPVVALLTPDGIRVRHADPLEDSGPISGCIRVCRREKRTVLNEYTAEQERKYISNMGPREAVFVAHMEDGFAGFSGIAPRWPYSERLTHCGEGGTWVLPEHRGKGVGTLLWRRGVFPWCRKVAFRHVGFFVMAHNEGSISFYESLGFRVCGYHAAWSIGKANFSTPSRWRCGSPKKRNRPEKQT